MSNPDNYSGETSAPQASSPTAGALKELQASYEGLRILFNMVLIGAIILHLSLGIFAFRELRVVRRQIEETSRAVAHYHNVVEPKINELQVKFAEYSRQHPAFSPVVKKYFNTNSPASSLNALPNSGATARPAAPLTPVATPAPKR
ncbi:MAG: hypothetical protein EXS31_07535 [Pedosphaera sp.]|nr:hypothetical protein [Pedosphaera sp.]